MGVRRSTEDFIREATHIHGNKYDYMGVKYTTCKNSVDITCPEHGLFSQIAEVHLRGAGCPVCRYVKSAKSKSARHIVNKFRGLVQPEEYKLIPLTQSKFAKVDNEDFDRVKDINWYTHKPRETSAFYALNDTIGSLHRFIMGDKGDLVIDHIDGDGLNNRKSNLRFCTRPQNKINSKTRSDSKTGIKGVYESKGRYFYRIQLGDIKERSSMYDTIEEASSGYVKRARELHKEFYREI